MMVIHNLIAGYFNRNVTPMINGYIKRGSILTVVGSNGVGKSTFLKTLAGLLPPNSGNLEFLKVEKPRIIGYLPQKKNIDCYFPVTVFDVVAMGCWPRINFLKRINDEQKYLIWKALKKVKLLNLMHRCVHSLSGGEFQRMLFARILVQQAQFILLDEPLQGIDQETCEIFLSSINQMSQYGCTIVIVLHDNQFASKYLVYDTLLLTQSNSIWIKSKTNRC
ncbi:ABC transporter (putative manganese transport system) [Candidatus Blochmanniella vafra str. BVAF]|uniref:ABC transporter (Putative manganese transport system) n=1 Tax=Blochmanniella vafra (strain BVAF) TaxID=859654 RepID=E8Q6L2_BLOVB|nr:ABC transporter ATP-binding protein [Candidatus Blochmannia vafer]ADV33453.1 ABC transporter (putative manganese transport system) [Candidatus Blochmannia vafer str. BVAF]